MAVMNVSSVWAADETKIWTPAKASENTWFGGDVSSSTSYTYTDTETAFKDAIFTSSDTTTNKAEGQAAYKYDSGQKFTIDITNVNSNAKLKLYMIRKDNKAGNFAITAKSSGTANPTSVASGNRKETSIDAAEVTLSGGDLYTFTADANNIYVFRAELTADFGSSTETSTVITPATSTDKATYVKDTAGKYYAVSIITNEAFTTNAENSTAIVQVVGNTELATSTKVYEQVSINGTAYKPTDFGGNDGDYLFASEITGVSDTEDTTDTIIANIQKIGYAFKQ